MTVHGCLRVDKTPRTPLHLLRCSPQGVPVTALALALADERPSAIGGRDLCSLYPPCTVWTASLTVTFKSTGQGGRASGLCKPCTDEERTLYEAKVQSDWRSSPERANLNTCAYTLMYAHMHTIGAPGTVIICAHLTPGKQAGTSPIFQTSQTADGQ